MKKGRLQFGLGTLLLSVALLAAAMGVWSWGRQAAVHQRRATAHLARIMLLKKDAEKLAELEEKEEHGFIKTLHVPVAHSFSFPHSDSDMFMRRLRAKFSRECEQAWLERLIGYHESMREKYERLARRPWLQVEPDPPPPPRSVKEEMNTVSRKLEEFYASLDLNGTGAAAGRK